MSILAKKMSVSSKLVWPVTSAFVIISRIWYRRDFYVPAISRNFRKSDRESSRGFNHDLSRELSREHESRLFLKLPDYSMLSQSKHRWRHAKKFSSSCRYEWQSGRSSLHAQILVGAVHQGNRRAHPTIRLRLYEKLRNLGTSESSAAAR